ncbi:MAG: hypothetical protein HC932_01760 [Thermales bacterium]|nr:hypothetical protein [Thermales bacterium]
MKVIAVTKDNENLKVIYKRHENRWYYSDGRPVPQAELDKFKSTIFKQPPNTKGDIYDETWFHELKAKINDRMRRGLMKKPHSTNH